ncbi:MAG: acetyl-CoA carboxylase biotin carboxylase subunit family protein [Myxococcota bacterium]
MHVIFLAPHFPANQLRFVQGLKAVGARVTGIIDAPAAAVPSAVIDLLDDAELVDNVTSVGQVTNAVKRIQARGPWVHRLEATVEAHTLTAARVREATGIPGTSSLAVERCRDKSVMKAFLAENGIPVAPNRTVDSAAEARDFARSAGFPVILKPRSGAGASGTTRIDSEHHLEQVLAQTPLHPGQWLMEAFLTGHELIYDTLTVQGEVAYEMVSHYEPGVLAAMRTREVSPRIVCTNRHHLPQYAPLLDLGRRVIQALGLHTTATHMEAFVTAKGLVFSEIGARPAGVGMWDCYCHALGFNLYTEWARAVCWGDVHAQDHNRRAAGLVAVRPNQDGRVIGVTGADAIQAHHGEHIFAAHLPRTGQKTQPVEGGYMANAWAMVAHDDYDACCGVLDDIGRTLQVHAE